MLQKCKFHTDTTMTNGYCLKCQASGSQHFSKIFLLQALFQKMADYKDIGAYSLAFKTFQILKAAGKLK